MQLVVLHDICPNWWTGHTSCSTINSLHLLTLYSVISRFKQEMDRKMFDCLQSRWRVSSKWAICNIVRSLHGQVPFIHSAKESPQSTQPIPCFAICVWHRFCVLGKETQTNFAQIILREILDVLRQATGSFYTVIFYSWLPAWHMVQPVSVHYISLIWWAGPPM